MAGPHALSIQYSTVNGLSANNIVGSPWTKTFTAKLVTRVFGRLLRKSDTQMRSEKKVMS